MKIFMLSWSLIFLFGILRCAGADNKTDFEKAQEKYKHIQEELGRGWNTWDTRNVLSHVLLPEGLSINLMFEDEKTGQLLQKAIIDKGEQKVRLIAHTYDGSYTELQLTWKGIDVRVQSATDDSGKDQVILVTPINHSSPNNKLIVKPQLIWGNAGLVSRKYGPGDVGSDTIYAYFPDHRVEIYSVGGNLKDTSGQENRPAFVKDLKGPVALSTGRERSRKEVEAIIEKAKAAWQNPSQVDSDYKAIYHVIQAVLSWNVIYDPSHHRVISPISREWSSNTRGGYVLFCWDNLFAAYMFSAGSRDLAYVNLVETIKIVGDLGFVPNHNGGNDISRDRSQPPIGSLMTKAIYSKYKEKWLIDLLFDRLLKWNRWWDRARNQEGYLCWGSDPYPGMEKSIYKDSGITRAKWESGLDNSPMYDNVPYDKNTHMMPLADVGLMSLYIADCNALAFLASETGRKKEQLEIETRAKKYKEKLKTLWNEDEGIYLNKRLDTNQFSKRLSPTNFYPLLAKVPTQEQAGEMIKKHFLNPDEFWGKYIMPSIARNDTAYKDNNYWRGRIWAPMNFLVYLGMLNYDLPEARKALVKKSNNLLMQSWIPDHYVYENYNAETGQGDDVENSDNFYHWGGLLGFMTLIDNNLVGRP